MSDQIKAWMVSAWRIIRGHWWLFPLMFIGLASTLQIGGLRPVVRRLIPQVDWLQIARVYAETGDIIQALAQPAVVEIGEFVLILIDRPVIEWLPFLAVLFTTTLLLLTLALLVDGMSIATVYKAHQGEEVSFGTAVREGSRHIFPLFLLASVPATPILVTMISLAISMLSFLAANTSGNLSDGATLQAVMIALGCAGVLLVPFGLFTLIFEALRQLANRACVVGGYRFLKAYRRAWDVLRQQPAPFLIMFALRFVAARILGVLLFVPGLFLIGIPLVWLGNTTLKTFFSTAWTLLWVDTARRID